MAGPSRDNFDQVFSVEIDKFLQSDSEDDGFSDDSSDCGWVSDAEVADIRDEIVARTGDVSPSVSEDGSYFDIDEIMQLDNEIIEGVSVNEEMEVDQTDLVSRPTLQTELGLEEIGQGDGPRPATVTPQSGLVLENQGNLGRGVGFRARQRRGQGVSRLGNIRSRGGRGRGRRGIGGVRYGGRNRNDTSRWTWNNCDNSPKDIPFVGSVGLNAHCSRQLGNTPSALDCLLQFLGEEFFEMICIETNDYADKVLSEPTRTKKKYEDKWKPVNVQELKAYLALYMLMGQIKKGSIQEYWSKRKILETAIFSEVIPFFRFNQISRFLHFADSDYTDPHDKLKKLRPVISYLENKFQRTYSMGKDVAIDESLVKLRARLSYVQYNPKKRARFGIKIYKICESSSGYCAGFKIYTGDDKTPGMPASSAVVLHLMEPHLDLGHTIFIDNWYNSPELCKTLLARNTHVVGTVNQIRVNMPEEFWVTGPQLEVGQAVRRSVDGILAVQWKDRKTVQVLSTVHSGIEMTVAKEKTVKGEVIQILKPKSVIDYNNGMLGVDVQDQRTASFPIMRRTIKAYKNIFFYFMDLAVFNSFCIWRKVNGKNMHYRNFRLDVIEQMLERVMLPARVNPGRPSLDNPMRLQAKQWAHFPMQIPPTEKKKFPSRNCKVCYKHKKRAEVRWICKKCNVALHLEDCFEAYHTKVDY